MADDYLKKFSELKLKTTKPDANYDSLLHEAIVLGENLKTNHDDIMLGLKKKSDENKKAGKLGEIISDTTAMLSKRLGGGEGPAVEDDFQQPLSRIDHLLNTLRTMLSKGGSLFKHKKETVSTASPAKTMEHSTARAKK